MPRKEPIKFNEFINLVPEEQNVMLIFSDLSVVGTQDAISSLASSEINNTMVINAEAVDSVLKVWVEYDELD